MTDEDAWRIEESLWKGSPSDFADRVSASCLMAFADPVGVISGTEAVEGINELERWSTVDMTEKQMVRPSRDIVILAYRAEGQRDLAPAYRAYCTSTYHRSAGGRWLLVQHQQTPIGRRSR